MCVCQMCIAKNIFLFMQEYFCVCKCGVHKSINISAINAVVLSREDAKP